MTEGILVAFLGAIRPTEDQIKDEDSIKDNKFGYTKTNYYDPISKKEVTSKFTYEYYLTERTEINVSKVLLVGTATSSWEEIYRHFAIKNKTFSMDAYREFRNEFYNTNKISLKEDLLKKAIEPATDYFTKLRGNSVTFHPVIITLGSTNQELNQTFEDIKTKLVTEAANLFDNKQKNKIICDITNGFRSFPVFTYMLSNYVSKVLNWKAEFEVFYGMFEDKTYPGKTPIVNLNSVDNLMAWINAANEFRSYASVKTLLELLDKRANDPHYDNLRESFNQFEYGTNCNDLYHLHQSIIHLAKDTSLLQGIGDPAVTFIRDEIAKDLGEHFKESLSISKDEEKMKRLAYFQFELGKWYARQGRTGQAAVTTQEALVTLLMWLVNNDIKEDDLFKHKFRDYFKNKVIGTMDSKTYKPIKKAEASVRTEIRNTFSHCNFSISGDIDNLQKKITDQESYLIKFQEEIEKLLSHDESIKNIVADIKKRLARLFSNNKRSTKFFEALNFTSRDD